MIAKRACRHVLITATLIAGCSKAEHNVLPLADADRISQSKANEQNESKSIPKAVSLAEALPVFAKHDCCDRFPHTKFKKVGDLEVGNRIFSIFSLDFSNPVSLHGMQQVAILEGEHFIGSYTTSGAKIAISGSKVQFSCNDLDYRQHRKACNAVYFQEIDLSAASIPQERIINGQLAIRNGSI